MTSLTPASRRAHHTNQSQSGDLGPYSHHYGYDVSGNINSRAGWGGWNASDTASYVNNRRVGMQYDAAGHLTFDTYTTATYDATGQAATAVSPSGNMGHRYDGDRLRVKQVENGAATYYVRSSVLGGPVVSELRHSGSGWYWSRGYVYDGGGQVLAVQYNGANFVHQDPVSKSQRVTDGSGAAMTVMELDPWGGETSRMEQAWMQPHRYTTYERGVTGYDEAQQRRYFGHWSRFAQPDPSDASYNLGDPQSFNRYAYVQNDPVNFVDPTGLNAASGGCSAEYSYAACGGDDGFWGGGGGGGGYGSGFGDGRAMYHDLESSGMPASSLAGVLRHEYYVNNLKTGHIL